MRYLQKYRYFISKALKMYILFKIVFMVDIQSIKKLIVIITVAELCSCLTFKLQSKKPYCMTFPGNGTYTIQYVSSGENDHKVKLEVLQYGNVLFQRQNSNDYLDTQKFGQGDVTLCFSLLDSKQKEISFDYYLQADPIKQMIDSKDLAIVGQSLNDAIKSLQEVGKNQQFHIQRDQINRMILQKSENNIKWAGIVKIGFLLTSAIIQLWIMKSFFKQNSIPYQPINNQ